MRGDGGLLAGEHGGLAGLRAPEVDVLLSLEGNLAPYAVVRRVGNGGDALPDTVDSGLDADGQRLELSLRGGVGGGNGKSRDGQNSGMSCRSAMPQSEGETYLAIGAMLMGGERATTLGVQLGFERICRLGGEGETRRGEGS